MDVQLNSLHRNVGILNSSEENGKFLLGLVSSGGELLDVYGLGPNKFQNFLKSSKAHLMAREVLQV